MADNDVLTRNDDGDLAVRTVSSSGDNYVNKNDVYTRDDNGNLAMRVVGAGGGGGSDLPSQTGNDGKFLMTNGSTPSWEDAVAQWTTMPAASADNYGRIIQYIGEGDGTYENGYFYKSVADVDYDATVSFEAATLSGTTVTCIGADFAAFLSQFGADISSITNGTMTYIADGNLWKLVGKDADNNTVVDIQEYTEDYEAFGFTFTGTPQDGDVIAFTCTVTVSYSNRRWIRPRVQPNPTPSQIGAATLEIPLYKKLKAADWSANSQTISVSGVKSASFVVVGPTAASMDDFISCDIRCTAQATDSLTFTCATQPGVDINLSIGVFGK